jgi:oligo-1,6-glucosidase
MKNIKKTWWKEQVVYQIYPRSFKDSNKDGIGDLRGIISKIDYLKDLGIDIVWLSPHYDSPNADNGYDIRDYYKVMADFGTMEDFDEMLSLLKKNQIKLIVDLVVNHSSDEHEWFKKSRSSKDNPFRDYYIWKESSNEKPPSNWPSFFGGSAWELDSQTNEYYLHYFAKKQPDLNWENLKVREEVYAIMKFWLDKGVDGFRMDVITLISKDQAFPDMNNYQLDHPEVVYASGPRLHEFLQEMKTEVLSKYDVMTVGEAFGVSDDLAYQITDERDQKINLVFLFDIARIGRDNWRQNDWNLNKLKALFAQQSSCDEYHWPTIFLNNHDNPRSVSKFGSTSPEFSFLSAKLLAVLTLTQKGTPFLYQGEEIGMTNHVFTSIEEFDDVEVKGNYDQIIKSGVTNQTYLEELNKSSRDHSRTPMQWANKPNAGFTEGEESWFKVNPNYKDINVEDQINNNQSVYHFYKSLLTFRKNNDDLIYGDYTDICPDNKTLFAYTRTGIDKTYLIVLNISDTPVYYSLPESLRHFKLVISNYEEANTKSGQPILNLRPWEANIYVSI